MTNNNPNKLIRNTNNLLPWHQPKIIRWSQIMAKSYQQLLNQSLVKPTNTPEQLAEALFYAPFVLVSHGTQANPIFNYGNQTALQLWSLSWEQFIQTPSASTTESTEQADREAMLRQAANQGYIDNYQGIRIAHTGKRFAIKQVKLWNLTDELGQNCGQAATFAHWTWL